MPATVPSQSEVSETHSDPIHVASVLAFIRTHGSITQADATEFGCTRLAARICEIRHNLRIPVVRTMEGKGRNKYARYSLQ